MLVQENGNGAASEMDISKLNMVDNSEVILIVANTLHFIWSKRSAGKRADLNACHTYLQTEVLLLRELQNLDLGNEIIAILHENLSEQRD